MNHQANHGVEPEKALDARRNVRSGFTSRPPRKYWMHLQPSRVTKATLSASAYLGAPMENKPAVPNRP